MFLSSSRRLVLLVVATALGTALATACSENTPAASLPDIPADEGTDDDVASDQAPLETGDNGPVDDASDALLDACPADECDLDGECYANEDHNPDNPCEICLVAVDPATWSADDTATCDDDDACTADDHCLEGACMGTLDACGDVNPCTTGVCDPETGECSQAANDASCSDGDPCTIGDQCSSGLCQPGSDPRGCDDANDCTADSCVTGQGCLHEPLSDVACGAGDLCTGEGLCASGVCVPSSAPPDCDDADVCTVDYCEPDTGACLHDSLAHLCSDDNPCTDEACDAVLGCVFPFNTDACNDDNLCTEADACVEGACLGTLVDLDDDNICTDLMCDPETGVGVVFNALPCEDDDACFLGDGCATGTCIAGTIPLDCDDANACTDDECDAATGCLFPFNTDACDDLDACTSDDLCGGGACAGSPITCDDGNTCTRNECDVDTGCEFPLILSFTCRPVVRVTFPARAATLRGTGPFVTVTGSVVSGAGPIESFTLNGLEVPLAEDGSFSVPVRAVVGGNILRFEAADSFGTTVERVQSFLWSPTYRQPHDADARTGMVDPGLGLFLGQEVLDDGDRTDGFDDFATIFQLVLAGLPLGDFVDPTQPLATFLGIFDIYALGLTLGDPTVAIDAQDGRLLVSARFANLRVPIGIRFVWQSPPTTPNGSILADAVNVQIPIRLAVVDHQLVVLPIAPTDVTITFTNLRFVSSGGFGNDLIALIVGLFTTTLENEMRGALQDAVANDLAPILGDAFGALAFDTTLPFPSLVAGGDTVAVRLLTDFSSVTIANAGLTFAERAGAYSASNTTYSNLGAMGRANCGTGTQTLVIPGAAPFEISLSDDTLNEILYAAWRGGFLEFEVPPELLGDVDFGSLGITDLVLFASGMLQPTAFDCSPDGVLLLHLGDLFIDASMNIQGLPLDVDIYASLQAVLELSASDEGIALGITELRAVEVEVGVVDETRLAFEPLIESAITDALGPGLLDLLGAAELGSFPLPDIPLGAIDGVPDDVVIAIDPEELVREAGNTLVSGSLR